MFLFWYRFSWFTCYDRYSFFGCGFVTGISLSLYRKSPFGFGIGYSILAFCRCCLTILIHICLLLRCRVKPHNFVTIKLKSSTIPLILIICSDQNVSIDISDLIHSFNLASEFNSGNCVDWNKILSSLCSFVTSILDVSRIPSLLEKILKAIIEETGDKLTETQEVDPCYKKDLRMYTKLTAEAYYLRVQILEPGLNNLWSNFLNLFQEGYIMYYDQAIANSFEDLSVLNDSDHPITNFYGKSLDFFYQMTELRSNYVKYLRKLQEIHNLVAHIHALHNPGFNYVFNPIKISGPFPWFVKRILYSSWDDSPISPPIESLFIPTDPVDSRIPNFFEELRHIIPNPIADWSAADVFSSMERMFLCIADQYWLHLLI